MRIGFILLFSLVRLYAADPRVGTWKEISLEENPTSKMTVTADPNGMHLVVTGDAAGAVEFTAKFDGRDYPVQHAIAVNQISLHQVNERVIEGVFKRDGRQTGGTRRWEVSADGKGLVITDMVTGEGEADQYSLILERKGGAKDPKNLLVGTWILNHAKTVAKNPEVLTYRAIGDRGVTFSGSAGYGYDADFDGKDYGTQQSPNDSVSLKLVDSRTVVETWKRQGKVAETVRGVVSADGQTLTMIYEGILTDGTHYRSKEVFRKY